jgi:hypothetical protein
MRWDPAVDAVLHALAQVQPMMAQYPLGFGQRLQALAYALSKPREIAIIGEPGAGDTQALLSVVRDGYRPFQIVALAAPDAQPLAVSLPQERALVDGQAAAYVCRNFACQAPNPRPSRSGYRNTSRYCSCRPAGTERENGTRLSSRRFLALPSIPPP